MKRTRQRWVWVGAAAVLLAGRVNAATYYVDSTDGSDTRAGTSADTAWQSLGKVNGIALTPGDRLLFRAGGLWKGTLTIRGAGTRRKRIYVGKYGQGARPRIHGDGGRVAVRAVNPSYLTVAALEITNPGEQDGETLRSGIEVVWSPDWQWQAPKPGPDGRPVPPGSVILRGLVVHDVDGVVTRQTKPSFYQNAGIYLQNRSGHELEDVRVEHCRIEDVRGVGCRLIGGHRRKGKTVLRSNRVSFCNNVVRRTGADGLIITYARNAFVSGNRCYDLGALGNAATRYIAGIWVGWYTHNSVFQYNEVARTRRFAGDGNAFDVDNECTGTHLFQYNYTHENEGGTLMVMPSATGRIVYRFNVSVDDYKAGHPQGKPAFSLPNPGPTLIYNNTFVMHRPLPLTVSDNPRVKVLNNIFWSKAGATKHPGKPAFRRNCFFGEHVVNDPEKVTADPRFVNPGPVKDGFDERERYRLRDDSPCRDAGIEIADSRGHGHYIGRPDVGAFEFRWSDIADGRQWRITELGFMADAGETPPIEVEFSATFTGPDGTTLTVPGFWDGGETWRIRFTPTLPGKWSYITSCERVQGLKGRKGTFVAAPAEGANPFHKHGGFLHVSENRRFLTCSDGTPFFWLGDTCWYVPSDRTPIDGSSNLKYASMFRALIDHRKAQGFTVLQVAFLGPTREKIWLANPKAWTSEQVAYWRRADQYIAYATEAGIMPVIGVGWGPSMAPRPAEDLKTLWRFMVARYGAFPVTWLVCGEYNQFNKPESVKAMLPLGQFIKDIDPYKRAMSIHAWYFKGEGRQAWNQPWYDFIMLQGGHKVWPPTEAYLRAYRHKPTRPVLESECNYEGIHGMGPEDVRWAAYRAIQSGSFGYTYGSHGLWNAAPEPEPGRWGPPTEWTVALSRPGGDQMGYLRRCYESVDWWKLEPRPSAVKPEGGKRIHTKADGDRIFLIYFDRKLDPKRKATLRGGNPASVYQAEWFNPRDGKRRALPAPIRMPDGTWPLPDRPDSEDWMLIVRSKQ